jgi:hypothetical protein
MALQAEGAHVPEVALASAFGDGNQVVGVPEGFAEASFPVLGQVPFEEEFVASSRVELEKVAAELEGVDTTLGADAFVAFENFLAKVGGIGAKLPFVDASVGAERAAAGGHFDAAAAA